MIIILFPLEFFLYNHKSGNNLQKQAFENPCLAAEEKETQYIRPFQIFEGFKIMLM